jgi:serine/threonine-protein kinase
MGAVYEAVDQQAGRLVALKLLHPELALDAEIHRRFRREASILQALDHPAVVRVLDLGTDEQGHSYTAMELLKGETLHARIQRAPAVAPQELVPVLRDACAGLEAAHGHGVIHGDIKPANLFLPAAEDAEGTAAKLVDFGLSKVHGLERLTRTGEVIGTPVYMAPELLTGQGDIDTRVDIYALGVVLYEALAGRTPFGEQHPGRLMYQIVSGDRHPLGDARPELPRAVVDVIERAMAPKRENRYETVGALSDAFAEASGP